MLNEGLLKDIQRKEPVMKIRSSYYKASSGSTSRSGPRRLAVAALGCVLLAVSAYGTAQIASPNGPQGPDNKTSPMGTRPDPASSTVHESNAPQSKDSKGHARGPTTGQSGKSDGAGGFNNGLYGTGTGSNK